MFIVAAVALCALSVLPLGGRFRRMDDLEVRAGVLLLAALAIQIVIISIIPDRFPGIHPPAHLLSYALAGAFFWANRGIAGLWLLGLGGALNFIAIAANGGVMPAGVEALANSAAPTAAVDAFINSAPLAAPKLAFLGDVFHLPPNWPLSNVFSIGDILIVAGAFLVLHTVCGSSIGRLYSAAVRATVQRQVATGPPPV